MKVGDNVLISPDLTHQTDWVKGKVIDVEQNQFVGVVISAETSVHFQPCKEISEIHNYRKKKLDYVRTQLTNKNENWMWDSSKSLADRREEIRKLVKEKTGRKMQSKAVPLHEAVVVIDEKTTMDDLKKLGKIYQQRFGIECVHISIHRDEGHWVNRNGEDVGLKPTDNPTQEQIIEGVTWKPNLHAHMVFDWYNHDNGKSWKTSKQDARDMQTIAAEVLSMGRGQESTKQHLDGLSYKLAQKTEETEVQEIYIKNLQTKANILREQIGDNQEKLDEINRQKEEAERRRDAAIKQAEELKEQLKLGSDWLKEQQVRMEEVKQSLAKELKQLENTKTAIKTNYSEIARQEADLKAYNNKKAAKEAFKSASEGVKGLFGQSSKDKTIKALRDENKALSGEKEALQEKVDAIPQAIQAGIREQLAKERARERNNYRTLYKEITGKTFFFNDEGYNPNESLKAIRELKQDYEREKEFSTQWMKYAKELEQKEEKRWGRGRGIQ